MSRTAGTKSRRARRVVACTVAVLFALGAAPPANRGTDKPPRGHYEIARAAYDKGKVDKAMLEVRLALQEDPLDAASHFLLGCLLAQQGEDDQATVGFRRALMLDPSHPEASHNLGTLLLRRGMTQPAAEILEGTVATHPDYLPPYNSLAKAYFLSGLPELAYATYEEVLRRDPSNAVAKQNLALLGEAAAIDGTSLSSAPTSRATPQQDTVPEAEKRAQEHQDKLEKLEETPGIDEEQPPTEEKPDQKAPEGKPPPEAKPAPGQGIQAKAKTLREVVRDLQSVKVEQRGDRLVLTGWTSGGWEREMLDRIIASTPGVLDLTSADVGDPNRMLEVDVVLFILIGIEEQSIGFNFLRLIDLNLTYFASSQGEQWTGFAPPVTTGPALNIAKNGFFMTAGIDYDVNIANAGEQRVAVLARPHLTTLNGVPASFLAGGEFVFRVSGIESGDIKPYPFGTSVSVTPTLMRTPGQEDLPRIHLAVEASRTSVLEFLTQADPEESIVFDKLFVTSEAVLDLGQTLILSGLNQRESRAGRSGVPILRSIPILKYFFSTRTTLETNTAIVILLTPRDPAFLDEQNQQELDEFVEMRRAWLAAEQGTEADMRRFHERYPDSYGLPPNRFASHFFLAENSELYRRVSGEDLVDEGLNLDLLGNPPREKKTQSNGTSEQQ